ncbi:MAG: hypothetical protein DBY45_10775 [Clostridiales bacterium]|nr:MAG: hypothetical protein DBY45_10775 [Clostridiales bacterium]
MNFFGIIFALRSKSGGINRPIRDSAAFFCFSGGNDILLVRRERKASNERGGWVLSMPSADDGEEIDGGCALWQRPDAERIKIYR